MKTWYILSIAGIVLLGNLILLYTVLKGHYKKDTILITFNPKTRTSTIYANKEPIECHDIYRLMQVLQDIPRPQEESYWIKEE